MAAVKLITETMLEKALRKHAGVFVLAARELGCDRSNVWLRVQKSPRLRAVVEEIEAEVGDICEGVIVQSLLAKDKQMARWYADRKLKHRGFSPRVELTDAQGNPLQLAGTTNVTIVTQYVTPADQVEDVV